MASSTTTVEIHRNTKLLLNQLKGRIGAGNNDEALKKALEVALQEGVEGEFFIDVLFIGDGYAKVSPLDVIFQVGTDPPRYYKYSRGIISEMEKLPTVVIKEGGESTE